ncbi:DNA polymerase III subunit beta [Candidatus Kaiserbacteria bacterium]|nr:DNA polymerase III subunit beta [Candidatus Kaiserbacteria bacterium]USN92566.1 MAG: DNA polymerase III subunit beta [Candidatus Nomurabacteria bacterium]
MEITIPHDQLTRALELMSRVSTKHVTLPVLQCVRMEAKGNEIKIQATNLEINMEVPIVGEVAEEGVVAVPAQIFLQSIQFISQKNITLRTEDQVLQLETETTNTSIKTMNAEEFPNLKQLQGEEFRIQSSTFAYGIKSVAFSASQTSIKPELGSVFIQQKKEHSLTFVATDSFRLMEKTIPQKGLVFEQSIMIPQKNAVELARVCDVFDEEPVFVTNENQCALKFPDGTYVSSRLTTGSFPDYAQIIPKEFITHVTVLKEDLLRSFKKTNIFLNKFRQVSLMVTDNSLTISSQNNDVGHTTDTLKAQSEGEDLTLNFNQQYIMDPLVHIHDESVKLSFAGIGRAMVMQGVTDKTFRYLVMPMNK